MGLTTCLELATASLPVTTARALALLADQTNQTPDKKRVSPRKVKIRAQYLGVVSEEDLFLRNVFSKQEVSGRSGGGARGRKGTKAPTGNKGEWEPSDQSQGGNNQGRWEGVGEEQIGDRREHSSG